MSNERIQRSSEFLRLEYSHLAGSFLENETLGERRVNLFLTIAGVVLAALGLKEGVLDPGGGSGPDAIALAGIGIVLVLGLITLVRLVRRNVITDEYLRGLGRLREYFVERDREILPYLPYPPGRDKPRRTRSWGELFSPGRGGLVENVSLVNALLAGGWVFVLAGAELGGPLAGAAAVAVLTWVAQFGYVKRRYDAVQPDAPRALPDNVFRANAGVVVIDAEGRVLALERCDHPGSWQMPQGGIEQGESPLAAAVRELREETALAEHLERIAEYPGWLAYELPAPRPKHGRGQVQKWFLFRFTGGDGEVRPQPPEFRAFKWTTLAELVEETAPFRRDVYRKLAEQFAEHLAG